MPKMPAAQVAAPHSATIVRDEGECPDTGLDMGVSKTQGPSYRPQNNGSVYENAQDGP